MSLLKYKKFHALDLSSGRLRRGEDFATGLSELDDNNLHKAVLAKITGKGTNLGSSEWH
jgi:hypothetical protein